MTGTPWTGKLICLPATRLHQQPCILIDAAFGAFADVAGQEEASR
jgi:hypothetical protein